MRIVFCIHTPAHVHLFRNIINRLMGDRHDVKILARDSGPTIALLDKYGFEYDIYLNHSTSSKLIKSLQLSTYILNEYKLAKRFNPNLIIGIGTDEPIFATLLRKPCIIFNDTESTPFQHLLNRAFADVIITPSCFKKDLGKKQVRIAGYKELAYLHPNYFKSDSSIFDNLGLAKNEKYIILRFNAFDAVHDFGKRGFTKSDQIKLVKELEKYARVFISPEGRLSTDLEGYRLPIPYERIHYALCDAQLLVTDTQTMTTEAAILGTPAVRCNSFVGPNDMGNFNELEEKYGLIYSFREADQAIQKAIELIQQPDLKEQWAKKTRKLLSDNIDVTRFIVDFIENYPGSFRKYKDSGVSCENGISSGS